MVAAVIVTHGGLGKILMDSVEGMLGPQTGVHVVSNEGASLEQIMERARSHMSDSPAILFVDFCGGSPYIACQALRRSYPECAILSGVNLPMLLSFFTKRDKLAFADLVRTVETDGHRGIQLVSP